jgi:hypothetical protein
MLKSGISSMHEQSLNYLMFWDIILKLWVFKSFLLTYFCIDLKFHFGSLGIRRRWSKLSLPFLFYFFGDFLNLGHRFGTNPNLSHGIPFFPHILWVFIYFSFLKKSSMWKIVHPLYGCNFFILKKRLVELFINE